MCSQTAIPDSPQTQRANFRRAHPNLTAKARKTAWIALCMWRVALRGAGASRLPGARPSLRAELAVLGRVHAVRTRRLYCPAKSSGQPGPQA